MVLGKDTELDFIAGDIEERGVGVEELTKDWVGKGTETRARDVYEGEGDGEEGNGDLH